MFVTLLLLLVCAILIWHMYSWQGSGLYQEMLAWTGTSRCALTVIYDMAITTVTALTLGIFFGRVTKIILRN